MTSQVDAYDFDRFIEAQRGVYETALAEIRRGRKMSHWMWFIFPQLAGLGSSVTARRYAIASLGEARAYLAHPLLGPRLRECSEAASQLKGRSAADVFGHPDDLKLCSSLTLFEAADPAARMFGQALETLCAGRRDEATLQKLGSLLR